MKKRVLHITPWYPSEGKELEAIWIQRHIASIQPWCENTVLHINTEAPGFFFAVKKTAGITFIELRMPIKIWRLREWTFTLLMRWWLWRNNAKKNFDVINFHIAYPSCLGMNSLRKLLPYKIVITEHWSFYHFNFFSTKKLTRIKNIFSHQIPVICVSKSLENDLRNFSGHHFPVHLVPNVVDTQMFHLPLHEERGSHFFMAARWKSPKDPHAVIHAISKLKTRGVMIQLRLGGLGPQVESLLALIREYHLEEQVTFLGALTPQQMAVEFQSAKAFVLPSSYETFSVVCAESLCCGCPVLTERTGALPEFIHNHNGILKEQDQTWEEVFERVILLGNYDHNKIAQESGERFSMQTIGEKYASIISSL